MATTEGNSPNKRAGSNSPPTGMTRVASGALVPARGRATARFRPGAVARDVGVDVTSALDASAPTFGNVLRSIGQGVAQSQTALDQGVIDMVNTLSSTNIQVVTDVVQVLNDDGLPDASQTQLVTEDVSVLNFFTPTVHEWKNVEIAMDLTVGSFHADQGLQFNKSQSSDSLTTTGLFWGFVGWSDIDQSDSETFAQTTSDQEVAWQSGQVRVDALLGPRTTGKLPVPASVAIGPQIYVTQGAVTDQLQGQTVTSRTITLQIQIRKADGSPNPNKNVVLNAGGLLPSFTGGTSATDANGNASVTLTRTLIPGFTAPAAFAVSVALGSLRKTVTVTL